MAARGRRLTAPRNATEGKGSIVANRVAVAPQMLRWARQRSGRGPDELKKFPVEAWESGVRQPTMKQLEDFAKATYTPVGFLFLAEPPHEELPIPDFRTFGDKPVRTPTPDLLDTIYACERRQVWYRDYAEANGGEPVELVGSQRLDTPVEHAADALREELGFGLDRRVEFSNWSEALDGLREHAEEAGVLVMANGVVGSNTHRPLNPDEFRGFALVDDLAPVVFINGADTRAAQVFTLAHELAHLSLGESAVSPGLTLPSSTRAIAANGGATAWQPSCWCRCLRSGPHASPPLVRPGCCGPVLGGGRLLPGEPGAVARLHGRNPRGACTPRKEADQDSRRLQRRGRPMDAAMADAAGRGGPLSPLVPQAPEAPQVSKAAGSEGALPARTSGAGRGCGGSVIAVPGVLGGSSRNGTSAPPALHGRTRRPPAYAASGPNSPHSRERPVGQLRDFAQRSAGLVLLDHEGAQPVQQFGAGPGRRGAAELRQWLELRAGRIEHASHGAVRRCGGQYATAPPGAAACYEPLIFAFSN